MPAARNRRKRNKTPLNAIKARRWVFFCLFLQRWLYAIVYRHGKIVSRRFYFKTPIPSLQTVRLRLGSTQLWRTANGACPGTSNDSEPTVLLEVEEVTSLVLSIYKR